MKRCASTLAAILCVLAFGCEGDGEAREGSTQAALTASFGAVADNTVRQDTPSSNDGTATSMQVGAVTNKQAISVVRFDQAAIAAKIGTQSLYSAKLKVGVLNFHTGWNGRPIGAHRMKRTWTERSSSTGATWSCSADTNVTNTTVDCTTANKWSMTPTDSTAAFMTDATDTVRVYSDNWTTYLYLDVTADVRAFLSGTSNFGWAVRVESGTAAMGNNLVLSSRQGSLPPALLIDYGPDLCTSNPNKTAPGQCGCAVADTDTDKDGTADCLEPSITAAADGNLVQLLPNLNDGIGYVLGASKLSPHYGGLERGLIRFDQAEIAAVAGSSMMSQALLELTIDSWRPTGWNGGMVDLYAMSKPWTEGTGLEAKGPGSTWVCASDTATANGSTDCTTANQWTLEGTPKPYGAMPVATASIRDSDTIVKFDVTPSVRQFLSGTTNNGWILVPREGAGNPGWIYFDSRETESGPRLRFKMTTPCKQDGTDAADCLCPADSGKSNPGVCGCYTPDDDTDKDGKLDCEDGCPEDAMKTAPGLCDCGVRDVDTDGDGAADCVDECPTDSRYFVPGDCGCKDAPKAQGTTCGDGLCAANVACDATGGCGSSSACTPDTNCTLKYFQTTPYWFCTNTTSWNTARTRCNSKGMDLVQIDSAEENAFVTSTMGNTSHIGATDSAVEGTWRWARSQQQFWMGTSTGSAVGGRFASWNTSEPDAAAAATEDCVELAKTGKWATEVCDTRNLPFVCEQVDVCPNDPDKLDPGQCGCGLRDVDSDGDGTADCKDLCPKDAAKKADGVCGCGVADTDTDRDGVPDCKDECPRDADTTAGGTCGCPSSPTANGTACCDGICGGGVCDGSGHCGAAASTCAPANTGCTCKVVRAGGKAYWYCPCGRTRDQAQMACTGKPGGTLPRITSEGENKILTSIITGDTWIGANDKANDGLWRWATPQRGDQGAQFWTGGAGGEPFFALYGNWRSGEPTGGTQFGCATMTKASGNEGKWSDVACSATANVLCEVELDRHHCEPVVFQLPCEVLGQSCDTPRDDDNCTPLAEAAPEGDPDASEAQVRLCTRCVREAQNPETTCTRPWAPGGGEIPCEESVAPVGPGTCTPFDEGLPPDHEFVCGLVEGSWGTTLQDCGQEACPSGGQCGLQSFCRECPAGQLCPCKSAEQCPGATNACVAQKVCGTWLAECVELDTPEPADMRCQEVEVCAADTIAPRAEATYTDLADPDSLSVVAPATVDQQFQAPDVPANPTVLPMDPACPGNDPNGCQAGAANRWCHYDVPNELRPRTVDNMSNAQAGDSAAVEFSFDPKMDIGFQVYPGPFGLMQFDVRAAASLDAGVEVNILSAHKKLSILSVLLEARAGLHDDPDENRDVCGVRTDTSQAKIFGLDILPDEFKKRTPLPDVQRTCLEQVTKIQQAADRAKKAYSDARELLRIYNELKKGNFNFGWLADGLCDMIASDPPFDFPVGEIDCEEERPEQTINRFIDFYNLNIENLRDRVVSEVQTKLDELFEQVTVDLQLGSALNNTEEIVIANATFPVGPIPVTLQVMLTASYGVDMSAVARLKPGSLLGQLLFDGSTTADPENPFAYIGAVGQPYAGAGIALFLGIGFDAGIVAAKIGVQGAVSLGQLALPLEAGAGIAIGTQPDTRAKPGDVDPAYVRTQDPPLIPLKKYSLNAVYKYSGRLEIKNVLQGSLDVVAKLKFLFFSKTFRAHVAHFAGMCTPENPRSWCEIPLFGGYGNAGIPFESVPWGTVLMPVSFLQLDHFSQNEYRPPQGAPMKMDKVEQLFYDRLCTCLPTVDSGSPTPDRQCAQASDCCDFATGQVTCFADPAANRFAKCATCRVDGASCNTAADCCSASTARICLNDPNSPRGYGVCAPRSQCGQPCGTETDCEDTPGLGDNMTCAANHLCARRSGALCNAPQ